MSRLRAFLVLLVLVAVPAAAEESLWTHNASEMRLVADGRARTFVYERPRSGIAAEGVQPGTVLFQGQLTEEGSGKYAGTSYIFSARCGKKSFAVDGELLNDGQEIGLSGEVPVVDRSSCRQNGTKESRLIFKFLRSEAPPPLIGSGDLCGFDEDPDGSKSEGYQACLETEANRACPDREDLEDQVRCFRAAIAIIHKRGGMTGNADVIADTPFTSCDNGRCKMQGGGSLYSCERIDATKVRECENENCNETICPLRQCRMMCAKSQ